MAYPTPMFNFSYTCIHNQTVNITKLKKKMKKKGMLKYFIVAATMGIIYTGCKKKDTTPAATTTTTTTDDTPQQEQSAADQATVENETNNSINDANNAVSGSTSLRAANAASLVSNARIDSIAKRQLRVTYFGKSSDSLRIRSGSITIQLDTAWHISGAVLTITFSNYKVTNVGTGKSITFNGTHVITNVNGGAIANITTNTVVHKIRGNISITFDDGTVRSWSIARKRSYYLTSSQLTESLTGDTTVNTYSNVTMWGTNRAGETFYVSTPSPVVDYIANSNCLLKPISGQRIFYLTHNITATYGVDASGNAEPAGTCPYGYMLNWTNASGTAKQAILSY